MATVYIGSARIDERGKASGGVAGDQTGKEVSKQAWYKHSKGWYVLRCKDERKAALIAECMQMACKCKYIGYDQAQRLTLYNAVKPLGFDIAKLTKAVETDCSALVRVCCAFAGITVGNFTTVNEKAMLLNTGEFVQMNESKYVNGSEYLRAGDILVTKTKGHTVVVLNDGVKAEKLKWVEYNLGERELYNGSTGDDVRELQTRLIALGYSCGDDGADGEYGDRTELAVRFYQDDRQLKGTGDADMETIAMIIADGEEKPNGYLKIVGGNCWFRTQPNTDAKKICVLMRGTDLKILERYDDWYKARMIDGGAEGYLSKKYAMEVDGM